MQDPTTKKNPTPGDPKKPTEGKSSRAKPPVIPIPLRSIDDQAGVERDEIVKRFGGKPDDWEVKDGFWVVKHGD